MSSTFSRSTSNASWSPYSTTMVFWIASCGMPGALGTVVFRLPVPLPRTCTSSKMPW